MPKWIQRWIWMLMLVMQGAIFANAAEVRQVRQGYKFINPLLECEMEESQMGFLRPFKYKIEQFIQSRSAKDAQYISVYFRDLNNGPWYGVNINEKFSRASLAKVPIMMSFFRLAEKRPGILSRKVKFEIEQSFNTSPYFPPAKVLTLGQSYSIEQLISQMIIHSDNDALQVLLKNIDKTSLDATYRDLGLIIPDVRNIDQEMTVKEYASFFRILFNASYLSKDLSERALALLAQSDFKDGIVAGVPSDVPVAHKFGDRQQVRSEEGNRYDVQLHDCGIVYHPGKPYLLCVMTRGSNLNALKAVIQDISRLVYNEVTP